MRRIGETNGVLKSALVALLAVPAAAAAQSVASCHDPVPPSIGFAVGRSSPYLDLAAGAVEGEGSVLVSGGAQFSGRADFSPGPFRLRVEAGTARWAVRRQIYDPNAGFQVSAEISEGHIAARSVVGTAGLRLGRAPVCAYVLAGGGVFGLDYRGAGVTRPGFAIVAGMEFPTGSRGAVQVDVQVNLISTDGRYPIAMSTVPAASLTAGWAYRFK